MKEILGQLADGQMEMYKAVRELILRCLPLVFVF